MCDEKGDECETLHTHVYFVCENGLTHTQVDARFPSFHRDIARGKSSENRAYVLKDGPKFNKQPDGSYSYKDTGGHLHEGVNFSDTFEEGGEMPVERQGKSRDADIIVGMIKDGATNEEIVNTVASAYRDLEKVERVRSMYRDAQFKNCWREFDTYDGQDVLIFEEFRGSLKHGDMLNYLDGYPLLLPCRYFNRQACFTKVFIITNIPPDAQYFNVDAESRNAFFRRIHKVVEYKADGGTSEYDGVQAYLDRYKWADSMIHASPSMFV